MSFIESISTSAPAASLKNLGDSVAGRIVSFEDYQPKKFGTDELDFFPSGDPKPAVRIVLEQTPGDPASQVTLWAEKANLLKAIAVAVRSSGSKDLQVGADLAVTHSHMEGRAKGFKAQYAPAEG